MKNAVRRINELLKQVDYYELDVPSVIYTLSLKQVAAKYNGVGSDQWSSKKREALTQAFKPYECCILIHDVCQHMSIDQSLADMMLYNNLIKVWAKNYGTWRWFKKAAWVERLKIVPTLYKQLVENRDA